MSEKWFCMDSQDIGSSYPRKGRYALEGIVSVMLILSASLPASAQSTFYSDYVEEKMPFLQQGPLANPQSLLATTSGNQHRVAYYGAISSMLWDPTGNSVGNSEYLSDAHNSLQALVDEYDASVSGGGSYPATGVFFLPFPMLKNYEVLLDAGELASKPQAFHDSVKGIAALTAGPTSKWNGDENRSANRVAGTALARQLFPDLDNDNSYTDKINSVWDVWYDIRDTTENSPSYSHIFLNPTVIVADLTGKTSLLQDVQVQQMFERFRDQVAPSGLVPGYGDDDGNYRRIGSYSLYLERAASLYQDPTYRWAAKQVHEAIKDNEMHVTRSSQELFYYMLTDQFVDESLATNVVPQVGSQVVMRNNIEGNSVPGQVVLAPDREEGSAFLLANVFDENFSGHSHPEQLGAIDHYEYDGVLFLRHYARNLRSVEESNSVVIAKAGENFPIRTLIEPGVWQEAVLPTSRLASDGINEFLRNVDDPTFRVEHKTGQNVDFFLDHIRLVGPAGEIILDDFEGSTGTWGSSGSLTSDSAVGGGALKFSAKNGTTFKSPQFDYNQQFNYNDYNELRFHWKIAANATPGPRQDTLIYREGDSANDMLVVARPFDAEHAAPPIAESVTGAQYGEWSLDGHTYQDTSTKRQTLLFNDGPLIVVDTISPGAYADGDIGGPTWHLLDSLAMLSGSGWYAFTGLPKTEIGSTLSTRMLVMVLDENDQAITQRQTRSDVNDHFDNVIFGSDVLSAGVDKQFVSLFLPFDTSLSAADVEQGITVDTSLEDQILVILDYGPQTQYAVITPSLSGVTTERVDVDLDGIVSLSDFLIVQDNLGGSGLWVDGDLTGDGLVTLADYQLLRSDDAFLPGDYDFNLVVDNLDLAVWKNGFGSSQILFADGDANGTVDGTDFLLWQRNYGNTLPSPLATAQAATVPEPTTAMLFLLSLGICSIMKAPRQRS